jgi:hypothetical protein
MPDDPRPPPDQTTAQQLAERAALRSITDTFRLLGIDITEMDDLNDLRDDFRYVRRQRLLTETRRTEATKSAVTALVGGIVGMLISVMTWLITVARHQP